LRTIASLLGVNHLANGNVQYAFSLLGVNHLANGNVQYAFSPLQSETSTMERPRSAPPLMRMVAQGVDMQNDGMTEFSRMQNKFPNDFNGADIGVEEGDDLRQEEGRELSYADVVLERFSAEQVKGVAKLLIKYVKDEVPIEKWEEQSPERTVYLLRTMLKIRDQVTAEGIQTHRMTLDKQYRKNLHLSQEIIGALEEARLAQEGERLAIDAEQRAKEEVDAFIEHMNEAAQEIEELKAELASTAQEMENFRANFEMAQQELDNLRFENSRAGLNRISEGHGRRATLLRSTGDLTGRMAKIMCRTG
jgi:hypothetical protein